MSNPEEASPQKEVKGTDQDVERVAKALYKHAVEVARERALETDLHLERLEATFNLCMNDTDRSVAILTFALAEELMLSAFKQHLDGDVGGGWKKVTSSHGVLATASDRITMLGLLRWIQPSTLADLMLMKSIRNEFAHRSDIHQFHEKPISGYVASLTLRESPIRELEDSRFVNVKFSSRTLYMMRSFCTVIRLMMDLAIAPNAIANRVHPQHVEGRNYDEYPEQWKEARRLMAYYLLTLAEAARV